jgi:ParB-like chromosome segregation protein Spo0J
MDTSAIKDLFSGATTKRERLEVLNQITRAAWLEAECPHPIGCVQWVPIEKVEANDYNPNAVASVEMRLLLVSITHDGYTQPVVVIWDNEKEKYVIVDGFHRTTTMRRCEELAAKTDGMLPVVIIDKEINDRMASTVRHNRARGKHSVAGMANMVFEMLEQGWSDERICSELGMSADELVRLKHVTGFSKLFENVEYRKAWEMKRQLEHKRAYATQHPDEKKEVTTI